MNQEPVDQLRLELQAFGRLDNSSPLEDITDAYKQILSLVQSLMLSSEDPDSHVRAWSLLNDDAYKFLAEVQEGDKKAMDALKHEMYQVGVILSVF